MRHNADTRVAKRTVRRHPPLHKTDVGKRRERWRRENAEAIAEYNNFVARHGTFSDGPRLF
jgi:hypothetical protein